MKKTVSVAPMMDCTDKHEIYFLSLISKNVHLFSEMIVANAIIRGDRNKLLSFKKISNHVTLQIGGSNPLLDAEIAKLENAIITSAIGDQENENFISSAKKLYGAYKINPENNQLYLYYAASSSVSAKDYDQALAYYQILIDINYEGIETKYYITEVASGNEIEVGSESEFNLLKRTNDYSDPREEETESKYPEIVKNVALIYNTLGQKDKALDAIKTAREANPDDVGLIITTANIYFELGDKEAFRSSMSEAIEKDPSNPVLYLSLIHISEPTRPY